MSELEQALAFMAAHEDRAADRLVQFPFGTAIVTPSLPRVYDLNLLRVERPKGASAEGLAAEAERIQGEAGLTHRRVAVPAGGEELAEEFEQLGWVTERDVVMAHRRWTARAEAARGRAEEVGGAELLPLRETMIRGEPYGEEKETVCQLAASKRVWTDAVETRYFTVRDEGEIGSCTDLYLDGGTAQIEDVATLERFRGRGHASAVVVAGLEAAAGSGHDFAFLVADADDWPQRLYEQLGFEELGVTYRFLRRPGVAGRD